MPRMEFKNQMQQTMILILFSIALALISMVDLFIGPVDLRGSRQLLLHIPRGSTTSEIAEMLYAEGLIKSPGIFTFFSSLFGFDDDLKAGYYRLDSGMSLWAILQNLRNGRVATYQVTIPEGYEVEDIARLLEKIDGVDRKKFLELARAGDFEYSFLPSKGDFNGKYLLEGFLFPDTYRFPIGAPPEMIIETMLDNFTEQFLQPFRDEIEKSKFSIHEIVTLASLIEKEAKLDRERELISGVIYNRLKKGMLLQIDATVAYSLTEKKNRLLYTDLEVKSPYNTYLHRGLPPGPIANPGLASLKAALFPADVDYLFYVARPDGSHVFTSRYNQHLKVQRNITE